MIYVNNMYKTYGGFPLYENVNFTLTKGDRIGLVGRNGSGKSTFLQLLRGEIECDQGVISRQKDLKIGYIPQLLQSSELSVFSYLFTSFDQLEQLRGQLRYYEDKMKDPSNDLDKLLNKYGQVQEQFELLGGYQLEDRIRSILKGLGLEDKELTLLNRLSGGERVRVELAKVLIQPCDVLLLDEPTNHLDLAGIQWLETYLTNGRHTYMVISHDRAFLDKVCQKIVEAEEGALYSYSANYSGYSQLKKERIDQLIRDYDQQQKEIQRMQAQIRRYRQWGNEGDNEAFFKKAKELQRRIDKIAMIQSPPKNTQRINQLQQATRSGDKVIEAESIGIIKGDKVLFEQSNFTISRGERLAILGENGSGKSTLVQLILKEIEPDEGNVLQGSGLQIGYLPQLLDFDNEMERVVVYVRQFYPQEQDARYQLAQFGFFQTDITKRIKDLSGGERVRLYLLKLFRNKINCLVLDEPTNHLDIEAMEEIESILENYTGTLVAVTHDRYFLERHFHQALVIDHQKVQRIELDKWMQK